jgi:valyl-tRNA synthetase
MTTTATTKLGTRFDPSAIESKWYQRWLDLGVFHADASSDKPPYCVVIPPPNVTGAPPPGPRLVQTIQDVLIRYQRMAGFATPSGCRAPTTPASPQHVGGGEAPPRRGTHPLRNSAATKFLAEVWKWKNQYHEPHRPARCDPRLLLDWERDAFTIDEIARPGGREVAFKRSTTRGSSTAGSTW